jgi:hypothetical protein
VTLPLVRSVTETAARAGRTATLPTLTDLRVLVVEANPIRQGAVRSLLERRVDTLSFKPTLRDARDDLERGAPQVVIASFPKNDQPLHDVVCRDLTELARACQCTGIYLIVTIDSTDMDAAASLRCLGASLLERPITANKLFEHIEGLHDWHAIKPAMRA